jgi:hypothetical protein
MMSRQATGVEQLVMAKDPRLVVLYHQINTAANGLGRRVQRWR